MSSLRITAFPPLSARVHEVAGPAAVSFAVGCAGQVDGHALWIHESRLTERVNPVAVEGFNPSHLLFAQTRGQDDSLAVAEDALREGALPLVVVHITAPLSLLEGRRLQLAAKAGGTTGLCLIPEGMGSPAAETRWHCAPVFDPDDSTLQRWSLIKNKSGTLGAWHVRWDAAARRVHVVSAAGE